MTTPRYEITDEQQKILDRNTYFKPASFLDDGDLLVLVLAMHGREITEGGWPAIYRPYVLTVNGKVQGISYHHCHYHDLSKPFTGRQAGEESTGGLR